MSKKGKLKFNFFTYNKFNFVHRTLTKATYSSHFQPPKDFSSDCLKNFERKFLKPFINMETNLY